MKLWYYAHRLSDPDQYVRSTNLDRAIERFCEFSRVWEREWPERRLIAPWISLAQAEVAEPRVWPVIRSTIDCCEGVLMDMDGARTWSAGMTEEARIAEELCKGLEVLP